MREHGYFVTTSDETGRVLDEGGTLQCPHCGGHFPVGRRTGKVRGWCHPCGRVTCGPDCSGKCVPQDVMLTNMERGRPIDFRPTMVPTS